MSEAYIVRRGGGGITMKKLWENASPASEFAAQTLTLPVSDYDFILIYICGYVSSTGALGRHYSVIFDREQAIGHSVTCNNLYASWPAVRLIDVIANGLSFQDNNYYYQDTANANNSHNVPLTIYGIKGVK